MEEVEETKKERRLRLAKERQRKWRERQSEETLARIRLAMKLRHSRTREMINMAKEKSQPNKLGKNETNASETSNMVTIVQKSLVQYIKTLNHITMEDKIKIKGIGRPTPYLKIEKQHESAKQDGKSYCRKFQYSWYDKYPWLCGCESTNRMYCFPCLLFEGPSLLNGFNSLVHMSGIVSKHVNSKQHINATVRYAVLPIPKTDTVSQIKQNTQERLENVRRNKLVINKIINFIKCCSSLDLFFLRKNDAINNNDMIKALLKFNPEIETTTLRCLLTEVPAFKSGMQAVLDQLTFSMKTVLRNHIKYEISQTEFVSIIVEDTSEFTDDFRVAIYLRFLDLDFNIKERFWGIEKPQLRSAYMLNQCLDEVLKKALDDKPVKLISQSYDGGSLIFKRTRDNTNSIYNRENDNLLESEEVMIKEENPLDFDDLIEEERDFHELLDGDIKEETDFLVLSNPEVPKLVSLGETSMNENISVAELIKIKYNFARLVPSHVHGFTTIFSQILSKNDDFRLFFANVNIVFNFFADFHKKRKELQSALGVFNLEDMRWNIKSKIRLVFINLNKFKISLQEIKCYDFQTVAQGNIIKIILEDDNFLWKIKFVNEIMNFGENLHEIISKKADISDLKDVSKIKEKLFNIYKPYKLEQLGRKRKRGEEQFQIDDILNEMAQQIKDRCLANYAFIENNILFPNSIQEFLPTVLESYQFKKHRYETEVMMEIKELRELRSPLEIVRYIKQNSLQEAMSNIYAIYQIILTLPPLHLSDNRTDVFHRVKKFLVDSTEYELNKITTLAILSVEHKLIDAIDDFNESVINHMMETTNARLQFDSKM